DRRAEAAAGGREARDRRRRRLRGPGEHERRRQGEEGGSRSSQSLGLDRHVDVLPASSGRVGAGSDAHGGVRIQRNHAGGAGRVARSGDLIPRRYDPQITVDGPAPLTFDDIARLVVDLAGRLRGEHDLMLVITRGGLIPGGILAYLAGYKNIVVAAVEFYDDDGRRGPEPAFHQFPSAELLHGRTVLIVDEVWDSGRTIAAV